jgi:hypothetical protein
MIVYTCQSIPKHVIVMVIVGVEMCGSVAVLCDCVRCWQNGLLSHIDNVGWQTAVSQCPLSSGKGDVYHIRLAGVVRSGGAVLPQLEGEFHVAEMQSGVI